MNPNINLSLLAEYMVDRYEASPVHIRLILAEDRDALNEATSEFIAAFGADKLRRFRADVREAIVALILIQEYGEIAAGRMKVFGPKDFFR
ncbi:MAG: hypothetical protein V4564_07610 [Pseudomonadota bacterium]